MLLYRWAGHVSCALKQDFEDVYSALAAGLSSRRVLRLSPTTHHFLCGWHKSIP